MQHEASEKAELEGPVSGGQAEPERAVGDDAQEAATDGRAEGWGGPDEGAATDSPVEGELAKWKELALRATADLDNYRKRMAREKTESLRYANQDLLEELLPVLDNFAMGLQAAAVDQDSMIFRGMEMVKKQLDDFLSGQGVEELGAEGQRFDPNVHEAVSQEVRPEVEEGTVLRVMRRGYRMHDRLLRPAKVVVARGPDENGSSEAEGNAP